MARLTYRLLIANDRERVSLYRYIRLRGTISYERREHATTWDTYERALDDAERVLVARPTLLSEIEESNG